MAQFIAWKDSLWVPAQKLNPDKCPVISLSRVDRVGKKSGKSGELKSSVKLESQSEELSTERAQCRGHRGGLERVFSQPKTDQRLQGRNLPQAQREANQED